MNSLALTIVLIAGGALLAVPRRWAPILLLSVACYIPAHQAIVLASFSMPSFRLMLTLGLLRLIVRRETIIGGFNRIDRLIVVWAGCILLASFFQVWAPGSGPKYAVGNIMNVTLSYFLIRAWCHGLNDAKALVKAIAILIVPVAIVMLLEHFLHYNLLSVLGAPGAVAVRDGKIRAYGAFAHPILAGTFGSVCYAYMFAIWKEHRTYSIIGIVATTSIVLSSNSSGPLMGLIFTSIAIFAWKWRNWMSIFRYVALGLYLLLDLVMSRPAYFIISKIDLTGSSTGWHRARLIQASIENFSDWFLFGTDNTLHWIGIPLAVDQNSSDITNYYIKNGLDGGILATLLVILMMWVAFGWVGRLINSSAISSVQDKFSVWCFGAGLFNLALSSLSISYYDQTIIIFWLSISIISGLYSCSLQARPKKFALLRLPPALQSYYAERRGLR